MPRLVVVAPVFNWKPIEQVVLLLQPERLKVGMAENTGIVAGIVSVGVKDVPGK
jgi:hypothetical protein